MITTAITRLGPPRPEDGSLRDAHPGRRAARLRHGGVRITRSRPLEHIVYLPDGSTHRRRTFGAAERMAHGWLDSQPHTVGR